VPAREGGFFTALDYAPHLLPSHLEKLIARSSYHPSYAVLLRIIHHKCAVLLRTIAILPPPITPLNTFVFAHQISQNRYHNSLR
jgi:hypothetical protein